MQPYAYPLELMTVFRAYAASLSPTPIPEYKILHPCIKIPAGYLPIRIVQFFQDDLAAGSERLHHWAIFIPTSMRHGIGNFYEIAGSQEGGYFSRHIIHSRHAQWNRYEKGSHLVGYVAPAFLKTLETHFSTVPIEQGKAEWNGRAWVVEALRGLNDKRMYAVQMDYNRWVEQMEIVEEAWEVGDA